MPVTLSAVASASSILTDSLSTIASDMTSAMGSVVPTALTVAGGILVVTLGWKLFRKFTKG